MCNKCLFLVLMSNGVILQDTKEDVQMWKMSLTGVWGCLANNAVTVLALFAMGLSGEDAAWWLGEINPTKYTQMIKLWEKKHYQQ